MKRGIALEGGGAKGAYHIGVAKSFAEKGYEFDGFVGTSIGAINAAVLAQGDLDKALSLWSNISPDNIFIADEQPLLQLTDLKEIDLSADFITNVKEALSKVVSGKGISTEKMFAFLNEHLDEQKIRASGKDFGLVTFSLSERKPYELMLDEIPQGKLVDYVMASASFPGFNSVTIDGKKYLDGGLYNNCPVNLLDRLGYDEIIAVRIGSPAIGTIYSKIDKMKHVKLISAKEDLGHMMVFSPEVSSTNIKLGYFDAIRFLENLRGDYYYIKSVDVEGLNAKLMILSDHDIAKVRRILGIKGVPGKRMLFEKIIPRLATHLKLHKDFDYADFIISLLERKAKQKHVERFQVYDYNQLCSLVKKVKLEFSDIPKQLIATPRFHRNEEAIRVLTHKLLSDKACHL